MRTSSSLTELLEKEYNKKLDGLGNKYVSFIRQASDRMRDLIEGLLEYSRLGQSSTKVMVDCNQVIQDIQADFDSNIR